jgi:NAD(P)-dependent dehydrogenase (short-subunit alcohol dehydrogenase family)
MLYHFFPIRERTYAFYFIIDVIKLITMHSIHRNSGHGSVCLVTGASRGLGRGIAIALGEAGATVICTGRSSEAGPGTDGRRETIEDTARLVDGAGGVGVPYRCDHTSDREIDGLIAWTLRRFRRIDVLVHCVWGGNEGYDGKTYPDGSAFGTPFWRRSIATVTRGLETGPYAALLTARAVAPLMTGAGSGLMVFLTYDDDGAYLGDIAYDLAKGSLNRLVMGMGQELAPHGVTALALSPGHVLTERVRDAGLAAHTTETPTYAGRAVVALASDPAVARLAARIVHVTELAKSHGFTDADGTQPERFRIAPPLPFLDAEPQP